MAMQQLQGSGAGQMSDLPQRLRLNATIPLVMEAADRIEAQENALREETEMADHQCSADIEAVAFINNRLADLAEANALYGKDQRLSAPDKIARNDREISWLKELRSIILTEPQTSPQNVSIDLMQRIWANLYFDEEEAGGTFQHTLDEVVDWLAARAALPPLKDAITSAMTRPEPRNPRARIEALEAALRGRTKVLIQLKASIDTRINDLLCETKPNYDDSIVGINDAWDVVRKACDEYIARAALAPEQDK
jgi:hypothetical protein